MYVNHRPLTLKQFLAVQSRLPYVTMFLPSLAWLTKQLCSFSDICRLKVTVWRQIIVEYLRLHWLSQGIPQWHRDNKAFHIKMSQFSNPFFSISSQPSRVKSPPQSQRFFSLLFHLLNTPSTPHAKSIPGWKWCLVTLEESVNIAGMLYILGTV